MPRRSRQAGCWRRPCQGRTDLLGTPRKSVQKVTMSFSGSVYGSTCISGRSRQAETERSPVFPLVSRGSGASVLWLRPASIRRPFDFQFRCMTLPSLGVRRISVQKATRVSSGRAGGEVLEALPGLSRMPAPRRVMSADRLTRSGTDGLYHTQFDYHLVSNRDCDGIVIVGFGCRRGWAGLRRYEHQGDCADSRQQQGDGSP